METNDTIWLITGDLGFGLFDNIRDDFPERFLNAGAAEQTMMDIAVGLALEGKIPFVYSITPFLLYRPFETIRTYINHEKIPVKMVGSGRDQDYEHDGYSHNASDVKKLFATWNEGGLCEGIFNHIEYYFPGETEQIPAALDEIVQNKKPVFLSLKR